ncbi:RNA polymerase sigma-70 factor (ECF subfamily) [Ancylobacter aquaticus]|uniref:RNA polymerase sigma-70 factor (ECF subfamily) n=1 Tax=Ancylobacter aquaticus TaxID=100 RepID=A0A4R1IB33_ANCAQ|nr:sigma-70 family RNA polymerase sigma factor [Ancylobacter aquaticus]TCK30880.1 RNA polymerase sigma-70 factor (ECF subfamily) [Ancylobacter aquaticus]
MGRNDWSGLYATHRSALVAYATPILGSREAAEDVVHDAFLKFPSANEEAERGIGYLYRIVRNLAFDSLKRRRLESRTQSTELPDWAQPAPEASPERHVIDREEVRLLARLMNELPPEQRKALEMYRFAGCTLEEVASRLGISVATAHRHVRAALARIAQELDRTGA